MTKVICLVLFLVFLIFGNPAFSGGQEEEPSEITEIVFGNYRIGNHAKASYTANFIKKFRVAHPEVKLTVEEIPGTDNYFQKLKVLLVSGELPDVILDTGENFIDIAFQKDALLDFTPYLNADQGWKSYFPNRNLEFNSRNGKVYGLTDQGTMIGYFYNEQLYQNAGIDTAASTWDEFWTICAKLKSSGIVPLALQTSETSWTSALLLGAIIGTNSKKGEEFMNTFQPKSFSEPYVVDAFEDLQKALAEYTTKDAIGGDYARAANNFLNSRTAMIFNGPWMIKDFSDASKAPEGFHKKVKSAIYPGGGIYDGQSFGMLSGSNTSEEAEATVKFFKMYFNPEESIARFKDHDQITKSPKVQIPLDVLKEKRILGELLNESQNAKYRFSDYQVLWLPAHYDLLDTHLPLLASGKMTAMEMVEEMNKIAQNQ